MTAQAEAFQRRFNVSRETTDRLETYRQLLLRWNPKINLVSKSTLADAWKRHMVDSAQIFELAPENARLWADFGSGGGFPGAVVAIMALEKSPDMAITLVESDQRKAAFLRTVIRETGAKAAVLARRVEQVDPLSANVVSARALAPLTALLGFAETHMATGGTAIFPKGATADKEIAVALESWRFDCEKIPSETDESGLILRIGDIERV